MSHIKLGKLFSPDWQGRPRHMSRGDLPIWRAFQSTYGSKFIGFHFDVELGTIPPPPASTDDRLKHMWARVTTKRIDVVGIRQKDIWIMEFRPVAGMSATGNAINYTAIWRSDPPDPRRVVPVVVTDNADPDIVKTAAAIGIVLIETGKA